MKISHYFLICVLVFLFACDMQTEKYQNASDTADEPSQEQLDANADSEVLEQQSEDFDKSLEDLNSDMNLATILNEKIQLVESQYEQGQITRQRADALITSLNEQYKVEIPNNEEVVYIFPEWAKELGLSEPMGMKFDGNNSFQTQEADITDGYNSILFIYTGNYQTALKEAERIAKNANIPMSETYQKAQELSKKLGKPIEGMKGMTYMNYRFGRIDEDQKYKISIKVDESGKLSINAVDILLKNERSKGISPI